MKKCLINFILLLFIFLTINGFAQDTMQLKSPLHKKNIFTLGLYKQPGLDSMVDFVDGLYRVFKINKVRGQNEKLNKSNFTFVPNVGYSLATGFATSINSNMIVSKKTPKDNQSIIFSELKYTQKKQIISQLVSNLWLKNNEYNITTNWAYLKFPQSDYGLGANSSLQLLDKIDYSYLKLYQSLD